MPTRASLSSLVRAYRNARAAEAAALVAVSALEARELRGLPVGAESLRDARACWEAAARATASARDALFAAVPP